MNNINFNETPYPGAEMLPFERYTVYNWVINVIRPKNILEIGTGVGGSTYFLSKALADFNTNGKIYTCDPSRMPCSEFFEECTNVIFYSFVSKDLINFIINSNIDIEYIFFDGPEDPNIALDDIKLLEKNLKNGVYFSMHDWEITKRGYDKAISTKALLIRDYIENSTKWKKIEVLSGLQKNSNVYSDEYDSVGLCLYQYIK